MADVEQLPSKGELYRPTIWFCHPPNKAVRSEVEFFP